VRPWVQTPISPSSPTKKPLIYYLQSWVSLHLNILKYSSTEQVKNKSLAIWHSPTIYLSLWCYTWPQRTSKELNEEIWLWCHFCCVYPSALISPFPGIYPKSHFKMSCPKRATSKVKIWPFLSLSTNHNEIPATLHVYWVQFILLDFSAFPSCSVDPRDMEVVPQE
jgi:hypothetical protein